MRRYYYIIINSVCFDIWNPLISRIPQYREFICQIYTTKMMKCLTFVAFFSIF